MGIFGFLSKAHSDQNLVSGDVQAKIAVYDEKIKTAKDNIDANRKALKQMDEAVDQVMGRSNDEKGADKAVQIRRGQQKERVRLQSEITAEQKIVAAISEERAPIAAEVRKVEAEVGPIKYIAKFIYGDKGADENMLEKAVTWIIILIVIVFDPLAIIMLLAAQMTFGWRRDEKEKQEVLPVYVADVVNTPTKEETEDELEGQEQAEFDRLKALATRDKIEEPCPKCGTMMMYAPGIGPYCPNKDCDVLDGPDLYKETESTNEKLIWESVLMPKATDAVEEAAKWADENKDTQAAEEAKQWIEEEESKKKNSYMIKEQGKLVTKEQK